MKRNLIDIIVSLTLAFVLGLVIGIGAAHARGFHHHHGGGFNWRHDPYYGIHPALRPFVYVEPSSPEVITVDPDVEPDRARVLRQLRECRPVRVCTDSECFTHPASECDVKDPWK